MVSSVDSLRDTVCGNFITMEMFAKYHRLTDEKYIKLQI